MTKQWSRPPWSLHTAPFVSSSSLRSMLRSFFVFTIWRYKRHSPNGFLRHHTWSLQPLGATSAPLFTENKASTRIITSGCGPRCLICTSTGTTEWRPAEFVKVYNDLDERSRRFEARKNFCQCMISLDLAASHQLSLSLSALFRGNACFTPIHVEQV